MGIPAAILAVTVAATAMSAYSAVSSSNYQASQANYQAQVAANNAQIQQANATAATLAGQEQQQQAGMKDAAILGAQRAAFAASGVDPNSGSALDVQTDQSQKGMLDQLTIVNNAARQAYGYQVAGVSDTAQGTLDSANSAMYSQAAVTGGFGSILSGASSVGGKYLAMQQSGLIGGGSGPNTGLGALY